MQRARRRSRRAPVHHHRRETETATPPGPYAAITAAADAGNGTPVAGGLLLGHTGDVQRAGGGATEGKSPASQAVTITTVDGPEDLGSGGFRSGECFGIGSPTTTEPSFWDGSGTAGNITATWDDTGATP
jgi:hypothetical protein